MPKKKPRQVKIPWSKFSDKFLASMKNLDLNEHWSEIEEKILQKTREVLDDPNVVIKLTIKTFVSELSNRRIKRILPASNVWTRLSEEEKKAFKAIYSNGTSEEVRKSVEKTYPNADRELIFYLAKFAGLKGQRKLKGGASTAGQRKEKDNELKKVISEEEVLEGLALKVRKWNDPQILEVDPKIRKSTRRVGFVSGISYLNDGFRAGAVLAGFEKLQEENTRFNILAGLMVDKHGFAKKHKELLEKKKEQLAEQKEQARQEGWSFPSISAKKLGEEAENELIDETAKALSSFIPCIRIPGTKDYVRLYVYVSKAYDGPFADKIAKKLYELRKDDIRVYRKGRQNWIKEIEKYIGVPVPVKSRLPSQYYSTVIEREIRDERHRASRIPDIWAVGPFASDVYTLDGGVRPDAYISLPGLRNLEEVHTAENQIGVTVLDFKDPDALPLKRSWSLRSQIENERKFIFPPKEMSELQKKVISIVQERRGESAGVIADFIPGHSREEIEKTLDAFVEKEPSKLKTWPGLYRDESDRYDFHLEWVQERLRYRWPSANLKEDRVLYFGCSHFGYTTTDYKHIIQKWPQIILENGITHIVGLGDFVAGMKHDLPHSGELIAGMNYTDHERFAAEGMATIIFRCFSELFKKELKILNTDGKKLALDEIERILHHSLLYFPFIPGNHDIWVLKEGQTPLDTFHNRLIELLLYHIGKILSEYNTPSINLLKIIREHIIRFEDVEAEYVLPSGLRIGMLHPFEGRSKTTSLKLQGQLGGEETCHIWAIANYHQATVIREWNGRLGERVGIMAGAAGPIYTFFERRKRQRWNDFGPIYVRTISQNKRIIMHEVGYFNKPFLKERISKYTNPEELKKSLGLLTI